MGHRPSPIWGTEAAPQEAALVCPGGPGWTLYEVKLAQTGVSASQVEPLASLGHL